MTGSLYKPETTLLPPGFTDRGATMDDLDDAIRLSNRWSQSVISQIEVYNPEAIRTRWLSPGTDLARDIHLVHAPGGQLAGYIEAWTDVKPPVHPWFRGRVDPDWEGRGLGTWLFGWAEGRVCQVLDEVPAELRFAPLVWVYREAEKSRRLFEDLGYGHIRSSYTMQIDMDAPPPVPAWAEGITVRTFDPEKDLEAVYKADVDSFRDHFGFVEEPYEEGLKRFAHLQTSYEGFDPGLWFLAMDGDEVAGISLCRRHRYDDPDRGWVDALGVRRPWRKRGIGLALLVHSFGELFRRGQRKVGLSVDAQNLTGALRLYEKAGMHVHRVIDLYEKEIRPGREFSVQSLSE